MNFLLGKELVEAGFRAGGRGRWGGELEGMRDREGRGGNGKGKGEGGKGNLSDITEKRPIQFKREEEEN